MISSLIITIILSIELSSYLKGYTTVNTNFKHYLLSDSYGNALGKGTSEFGLFNFSAPGESYYDMLQKLKYLVNYANPKRVFISIDDHNLSEHREVFNNHEKSIFLRSFDNFSNFGRYLKVVWIDNFYFNQEMKTVFQNIISYKIVNFFTFNEKDQDNSVSFADFSEHEKNEDINGTIQATFLKKKSILMEECLEQMIQICKINNIELVAIKFPLTKDFYDKIQTLGFLPTDLLIKNNIILHDFTDIYFTNDTLFYNHNHLNDRGAKNFNKLISINFFQNENEDYFNN